MSPSRQVHDKRCGSPSRQINFLMPSWRHEHALCPCLLKSAQSIGLQNNKSCTLIDQKASTEHDDALGEEVAGLADAPGVWVGDMVVGDVVMGEGLPDLGDMLGDPDIPGEADMLGEVEAPVGGDAAPDLGAIAPAHGSGFRQKTASLRASSVHGTMH